MLTKAGAKLMDFGLAKPSVAMTAASDLLTPSGPTMSVAALTAATSPLTQKGMIVGTFQYIAPEVLQGKEADARSDIFSLGCVLFEMATGKRAFEGKSQLSVFTAILENEPPLVSSQQPVAPKALDEIVKNCVAKDQEARCEAAIARFRAAGGKRSDSRAGEDGDRSPSSKYSAWGGDLGVAGCSTVGICARWKEERRRSIAATNCAAGED
jgi:serine/threonine protein kinase